MNIIIDRIKALFIKYTKFEVFFPCNLIILVTWKIKETKDLVNLYTNEVWIAFILVSIGIYTWRGYLKAKAQQSEQ